MIYLLDSNAWIAYLRLSEPNLVQQLRSQKPGNVGLSTVVLGELLFGAHHGLPSHRTKNMALIAQIRQQYPTVALDEQAAEHYGEIREQLTAQGNLIGPNDLLIAATARAHGLTLVTRNMAEFGRVRGLKLEDWQGP